MINMNIQPPDDANKGHTPLDASYPFPWLARTIAEEHQAAAKCERDARRERRRRCFRQDRRVLRQLARLAVTHPHDLAAINDEAARRAKE
jgi:hypothetical protein